MPRILYAEDDETLAFLTRDNLEQNGFDVVHCDNGELCSKIFADGRFDICILDIMLPKKDGFELASEIRTLDADIPIIFLSAKTLKEDRIKGLKLGADDYLVKPFSIEELILKINIFLKRAQKRPEVPKSSYSLGNASFDPDNFSIFNGDETIALTQRESSLLKLFLDHRNEVLKREEILKKLWGDDDYFMGRSLDVFISKLRKILAFDPGISIENIHGIGFRYTEKINR